jgi:hypothetical protein
MALYDCFVPNPPVNCPRCGKALRGWQSKDGEPRLLVWEQGHASPVDEIGDDELKSPKESLQSLRLPSEFCIYGARCDCGYDSNASYHFALLGTTDGGVWKTLGPDESVLRLKDVGDEYLQCPICCDVVERRDGWRLYLCPTCEAERWFEKKA